MLKVLAHRAGLAVTHQHSKRHIVQAILLSEGLVREDDPSDDDTSKLWDLTTDELRKRVEGRTTKLTKRQLIHSIRSKYPTSTTLLREDSGSQAPTPDDHENRPVPAEPTRKIKKRTTELLTNLPGTQQDNYGDPITNATPPTGATSSDNPYGSSSSRLDRQLNNPTADKTKKRTATETSGTSLHASSGPQLHTDAGTTYPPQSLRGS